MLTTELFSVFMKFLFVGISSGSAYIVSRQKLNRPFLALFLLLLGGIFALDATYVFYPEPLIAAAFYMSWCLELALIVKVVAFPAEQFLAKGKGLAEKYPGLAFTPPSVFVVCALILGFSAFIFGTVASQSRVTFWYLGGIIGLFAGFYLTVGWLFMQYWRHRDRILNAPMIVSHQTEILALTSGLLVFPIVLSLQFWMPRSLELAVDIGTLVLATSIVAPSFLFTAQEKSFDQFFWSYSGKEQLGLLRTAIEQASEGIAMTDTQGRMVFMNSSWARMHGYEKEELMGKKLEVLQCKVALGESVTEKVSEASRVSEVEEANHRKKDGSLFPALTTSNVIKDRKGKAFGTMSISKDMSQLRKMEQAYRSVVENSLQGFAISQDNRYVFANQTFASIFGYEVEELQSLSAEETVGLVHSNDRETVSRINRDLLAGKLTSQRYEFRGIRKDGSIAFLEMCVVIVDYNGRPAIQSALVDVTEQEKSDQAARDSEQCLRSVANSAADAVMSTDAHGRITFANKTVETMFGYPVEEVLGKSITMLIPERLSDRHKRRTEEENRASDQPSSEPSDLTGRRKDGTAIQVEASSAEYTMRDKTYCTVMLRDVSERKKIQERLKKLNECFLGFKADPNQNINSLVALSGELLEASFALYNRFDNGELLPVGKWNVPSDYEILDKTEGQICSATVRQNTDDVLIVRDLMNTAFARTDVNVMHYQLQAFVSAPVKFGNARVGSLCIVYKRGFEPNEEDMKLLGLLSSAIGVEEARRHSESSLHDSEERFRAISASAVDAIVLVDEGGRISYWNPAAQRIFGYSKEEALGKIAFKLVSPKRFQFTVSREFEDFLNVTQAALDGKVLEYAVCRKDGSEFPAELSISSLQIRGRSHAVVIIRDITTRKTMEQDLREGEEKYRNISKKLQGLMKSSAAIIHTTDVRKRLNAIAEAVHSQGWGRVVITLRDESLNATELVSAGLTPQEEQYLIAHQAPGSVWQKRLSSMFERYRLGEFYYLPWSDPIVQEQFKHALTSKVKKTETVDWDPDDLLYVPLKLPDGQIVGIMSIDDPKDGKRPTQSHFLR